MPTCHVREGLEIDHLQPFAEGGPTRLDNLARLCHWRHRQKSLHGWALTGAPGDWRWRPPALDDLQDPRSAPIEPEAPTLALSLPP